VSLRTDKPPCGHRSTTGRGAAPRPAHSPCPAGPAAPDLVVRDIRGPEEMACCVTLYNEVIGLRPDDGSINPRLLIALQANSGIVIGAYAGCDLVGFTFSFLARQEAPPHRVYQYSQLAVVAREHQSTGVGRLLKQAQRARCLAQGITLIRWAFDPLKTRNAHFNLDVLGGRVSALVPAMYGTDGFGEDCGEATDRFIVDWNLDEPSPAGPRARPVEAGPGWSPGQVHGHGDDRLVVLPDDWQRYREEVGTAAAAELRSGLRATFADLLTGYAAVSCARIGGGLAAYRFRPEPVRGCRTEDHPQNSQHPQHSHQES
jgi:predicted GNAT superfamily acetyltransferase